MTAHALYHMLYPLLARKKDSNSSSCNGRSSCSPESFFAPWSSRTKTMLRMVKSSHILTGSTVLRITIHNNISTAFSLRFCWQSKTQTTPLTHTYRQGIDMFTCPFISTKQFAYLYCSLHAILTEDNFQGNWFYYRLFPTCATQLVFEEATKIHPFPFSFLFEGNVWKEMMHEYRQ